MTLTVLALGVHQLAATKFEGAGHAGTNVENLEVRHPLQGKGLVNQESVPPSR